MARRAWVALSLVAAMNATASAQTVTVITDSLLQENKHNSTVQVEFPDVSLEDLSKIEVKTADGQDLVQLGHHRKIEVTVFLPAELEDQDREAFLEKIKTSLNAKYKYPVYTIRPLLIPTREIVEEGERLNAPKVILNSFKSWRDKAKQIAHKILNNRFNARARDLTVGGMIGLSKSFMGVSYWLTVTGFNPFGIAQSILSVGLDTIFHVFPVQINRWKGQHEIPFMKDSKLIEGYNKSPLVKAFVVNQAIHFIITYVFRLLSYLDDPDKVSSPNSVEFLSLFTGLAAVGTPIGAAGDMGVRTLARKGYISGRTEHYIFNLFGLELQINGLLFGSGRTEWLPIGLAVEWGGKIVSYLLATSLKAKSNRIVIAHPDVVQTRKNDILYLMGMENVLQVPDLEVVSLDEILNRGHKMNCELYLKK